MRFKRVLFISPHYPANHYGGINYYPPMGIAYICEFLNRCGIKTSVVDMGKLWPIEYLSSQIDQFTPNLIAISMMTFQYKHHYELLTNVKAAHPAIPIVAGGPHLTAWKNKVLDQCAAIDFGVSLEGELTMKELCEGVNVTEIKGLIYRDNGKITFNGERPLIEDLDAIPFPQYSAFDLKQYYEAKLICSSRGCPYDCIFCQSKSALGREFRARSAQSIFKEIIFWYERGYRIFNFVDDNFTLNKKRIHELCKLIATAGLEDLDLYASGVRADRVDYELLLSMKNAGFSHLSFGVESASNNILKILKKNETIETIENSVKMANCLGFYVTLFFMVGSPYETLADVKKSMAFANKYATGGCNFGSVMPIPDTELMKWVQENGTLLMDPEHYLNDLAEYERVPYFEGAGMTREEKHTALRITEKLRLKVNQRYKKKRRMRQFVAEVQKIGARKAVTNVIVSSLVNNEQIYCYYKNNAVLQRAGRLVKKILRISG